MAGTFGVGGGYGAGALDRYYHSKYPRYGSGGGLRGIGATLAGLESVGKVASVDGVISMGGAITGRVTARLVSGLTSHLVKPIGDDGKASLMKKGLDVLTDVLTGMALYEGLSRIPRGKPAADLALYTAATRTLSDAIEGPLAAYLNQMGAVKDGPTEQVQKVVDQKVATTVKGLEDLLLPENAGVGDLVLPSNASIGDHGEVELPDDTDIADIEFDVPAESGAAGLF